MRIVAIENLHADAGWFTLSFLKIITDTGLVGWAEYRCDAGNAGLTDVIRALAEPLIGADPRSVGAIATRLAARTVQARSGLNHQAIGAIVNALLDIKGKAYGVPVSALLGGQIREQIDVYWSHCGSYRLRHATLLDVPPVQTLTDLEQLGRHVRQAGFSALKTSLLPLNGESLSSFGPGFGWTAGFPALNAEPSVIRSAGLQMEAFRAGVGEDFQLMLDANCHFKLEGFLKLARALAPHGLEWLEVDGLSPIDLAHLRRSSGTPIGSCEAVYGAAELLPFLSERAVDVVIVDANWNGYLEALNMAVLAHAHGVNVATHGYGGLLSEIINAHFAASIPNLRIMEIDIDHVPWMADFYTGAPQVEQGILTLSSAPGWGIDVNEAAVRARPAPEKRG